MRRYSLQSDLHLAAAVPSSHRVAVANLSGGDRQQTVAFALTNSSIGVHSKALETTCDTSVALSYQSGNHTRQNQVSEISSWSTRSSRSSIGGSFDSAPSARSSFSSASSVWSTSSDEVDSGCEAAFIPDQHAVEETETDDMEVEPEESVPPADELSAKLVTATVLHSTSRETVKPWDALASASRADGRQNPEAHASVRHIDAGHCGQSVCDSASHAPVFDLGSEWDRVAPPCIAAGHVLRVAASQTVIDPSRLSTFIREARRLLDNGGELFDAFMRVIHSWLLRELTYERLIGWLSFYFATVPNLIWHANVLLVKSDSLASEVITSAYAESVRAWRVTFRSPVGVFVKTVTYYG